ncbi:MAG: glucosaminidase domain-containing protein [Bacilli bacterium]|nr:glucosaminidase domain-containing protein [Bacilli bacterium]
MKPTIMVYLILIFGLMMALIVPQLFTINYSDIKIYQAEKQDGLAKTTETIEKTNKIDEATKVELAVATPIASEVKPVVEEKKSTPVVAKAKTTEQIVFDNLTMNQLIDKLNRVLKSNLAGTGNIFVKYTIENGVDPYLATAIVLHETGCNWRCSAAVRNKNNVGGMMGNGGLIHFNSLEEGIKAFVVNLKERYFDKGLNTPELINKKYAANPNWHVKINSYINKIKQA